MSASRREREQFIATTTRNGIGYADACRLLRYAATLQRLAEASCNGDWPFDNGERKTEQCAECEGGTAPSALLKGKRCPGCRTSELARVFVAALCADDCAARYSDGSHAPSCARWSADFQGDPRGYVFRLHSGPLDNSDELTACRYGNCSHVRIGVPA